MRNIWNSSNKVDINLGAVFSIIILLAVIMWSIEGIDAAVSVNNQQKKVELETSIKKTVALCYSIEGCYPPNIEYLIDNYNLKVDNSQYVVHYEIFASNIAPEIKVFDMEEKK